MPQIVHNEKTLINFIKYGAIIIIIIFSFFITNIFIKQKNKDIEKEFQKIEEDFISKNKVITRNLVNKIYSFIEIEKKFEEKELKENIKEQVNQIYSVIEGIYNQSIKNPNYSKDETIQLIKESVRNLRSKNNLGYVFIYELDGKNILNSEYPHIEGTNLWNHKDAKGTLLSQEIKKILSKQTETFYTLYWEKPNDNSATQYEKLVFLKKFEPYGIFIGTGQYIEDFEKKLQKSILNKINYLEFKEPEHLFIYDSSGLTLVNPKKELIGTNRYNSQNKDGRYVLRELIEDTLKNKEGFYRYKGALVLNNENISNDKISFLQTFEDWNWVIGSGFYLEELNNEIKEKKDTLEKSNKKVIDEIITVSFFATMIMIIFSFYLSSLIATMFRKYTNDIKIEVKKSLENKKLLMQQSKMAIMGEMLGNIAHQWKQPLSLIAMSNTLLKLNQETKDTFNESELKEAVKNIDISVKHLSQTIDDFRDFFRPEKEKSIFYLDQLFHKTCELISSQFKNNNIIFVKDIQCVELYGRSNELSHVLINIIKNAKDELVKIQDKKRLIFINIYKENSQAIIKIRDNAGGIEKNILNKIFDQYFTTKKQEEGTGIGLYMSKQIIQEMEGKIEVSNVNFEYEQIQYTGAEFTISLDLKDS